MLVHVHMNLPCMDIGSYERTDEDKSPQKRHVILLRYTAPIEYIDHVAIHSLVNG